MTSETREALERWRRHRAAMESDVRGNGIRNSPYWRKPEPFQSCFDLSREADDAFALADDYSRIVAELEEWRQQNSRSQATTSSSEYVDAMITAILEGK